MTSTIRLFGNFPRLPIQSARKLTCFRSIQLQRRTFQVSSRTVTSSSLSHFSSPISSSSLPIKMVGSKSLSPSPKSYAQIGFYNQFKAKPRLPSPSISLAGKTAIVTGGGSGLGLEASRQLLTLGLSRLIIAARSLERGEAAAETLRQVLHQKKSAAPTIEVWHLDMCSYPSVQSFARRVSNDPGKIDLVLLNAGVSALTFRAVTPSQVPNCNGQEENLVVNYLSIVLLATLLLPILRNQSLSSPSSPPPRLVMVGSTKAFNPAAVDRLVRSSPILSSFSNPTTFTPDLYDDSKLLAHMFLWKLVDFLPPSDSADSVIVSIADPSWCKGTSLFRDEQSLLMKGLMSLAKKIGAREPEVGASSLVDALVGWGDGRETHGSLLMSWEKHPFNAFLYTPEGARLTDEVWEETMAELEFAGVRGIIESMRSS